MVYVMNLSWVHSPPALGYFHNRKKEVLNLIKESIYAATYPDDVESFLRQRLGIVEQLILDVTTESWDDNDKRIVFNCRICLLQLGKEPK